MRFDIIDWLIIGFILLVFSIVICYVVVAIMSL